MGSGFSKMKKQAKMLEQQMQKMDADMEDLEVTGEAAGGLVKITLDGKKRMKSIEISPECADDVEALQDLVLDAHEKAFDLAESKNPMAAMTGGLPF